MAVLQALRNKTQGQRGQISQARSLPSPTKGWFVGANLAEAPDGTAYQMDNAFPELLYVRARGGSATFATLTGMGSAPVTSLMPYINGDTAIKLFAFCGGSIWDVTAGGTIASPLVSGLSSTAIMSAIQFSGSGVQYLLCADGVDPVQLFSGTVWGTTPAITGLTGNNLSFLWVYNHRVYGIEANSMHIWYLGLDTIGGAAVLFPAADLFSKGGYLLAGAAWSIPTVAGLEASMVFISSEGEVAVYQGLNPGDTSWSLQGIYKVSPPLGPNCFLAAGGDLAIMTQDGIVPMSKVISLDQVALQNQAITMAIQPQWQADVIARQAGSGWQMCNYPLRTMTVVNLPKANSADKTQYVVNSRTGAWCRYLGWDANCFAVSGVGNASALYYGSSTGTVCQAETGGQDIGSPYTMTVFWSFSGLAQSDYGGVSVGQGLSRKQIRQARPRISTNFQISPLVTINVDFNIAAPLPPPPSIGALAGAAWGSAVWGSSVWPATLYQYQTWDGVFGLGYEVAPIVQVTLQSTLTPDIRLTAIDLLFEPGNMLG